MASIINASNSSGLTFTSDMSGVLQLQQNGVALPALSVAPAFSAYRASTNQSISANTWTKVQIDTETFDTNSNFDNTTNYRFTPTVAGYYQINGSILFTLSSGTATVSASAIYKNGGAYAINECVATVSNGHSLPISTLVYMNGSTDYLELYGYCSSASAAYTYGASNSFMNGSLVRGA